MFYRFKIPTSIPFLSVLQVPSFTSFLFTIEIIVNNFHSIAQHLRKKSPVKNCKHEILEELLFQCFFSGKKCKIFVLNESFHDKMLAKKYERIFYSLFLENYLIHHSGFLFLFNLIANKLIFAMLQL